MKTESITLQLDPEAARAFKEASPQEQRKLEALVSLRLLEATRTNDSLEVIMRDISRKARERGLTQEILTSILDED
jgi:hypothetical protein